MSSAAVLSHPDAVARMDMLARQQEQSLRKTSAPVTTETEKNCSDSKEEEE